MSKRALMLTPDVYYLDRRIVQEAGTLAADGWRVDIHPTNPALAADGDGLPEGVRLLRNSREGTVAGGLGMALRRVKRGLLEAAPAVHRGADALHHLLADRCVQITRANLPFLLNQEPYGLVFAHDVPVLPLAMRLKERWRSPLICDLHEIYSEIDTSPSRPARRYWRRVETGCLPAADGILAVNRAVAERAEADCGGRRPVEVLLNAAPYQPRSVASRTGRSIRAIYPVPDEARILLYAGTLIHGRNLEVLVEGFLRAGLPGWALVFLGRGPLADRLAALARRAEARGRVFLGSSVGSSELNAMASTANAGVIPYPTAGPIFEICTPNKLFECAQARLPVLASRLPMVAQLLAENGNGVCRDLSTPEAVAEAVRAFVSEDLPRFAPEALERAARSLCWENEEPKLLKLVGKLVG